jgi:pSer/pThr/pTyr-binding forkhead associated (FHA) protein
VGTKLLRLKNTTLTKLAGACMNKIIIECPSGETKEVTLEHGSLTLGRAGDNDIQLKDNTVSSHHAKIVTIFNASHIEDLNSTNGSRVNGKKVIEHTLHDGDTLQLGRLTIRFISDVKTQTDREDTIPRLTA